MSRSTKRLLLTLCALSLIACLLLCLYSPAKVHADGGAPNLAYVSGTAHGISVIDVGQAKVIRTLNIAGDPHTIFLSTDGRFLSITQPAVGEVSIVAAKTGRTICTAHLLGEPTLLAMDQNTNLLYAAGNGATRVSAIDPATCAILRTFQTNSPVYGLGVTFPQGNHSQLWVAGTSELTVFDDRTGQALGSIPVADGPQNLAIPPANIVYVTTRGGNVDAVDFKNRVVHQLLTGGTFGTMDYDALTGDVYVPDEQHNQLDVLTPIDSGATKLPEEPNRVIHIGAPPASVAITNDGLLGFVALRGGQVAMLDLIDRRLVFTVPVGGSPHFVITGLYPPSTDLIPPAPVLQQGPNVLLIIFFALLVLVLVLLALLGFQLRQLRGQPPKHL